jgi:hypothetical protein
MFAAIAQLLQSILTVAKLNAAIAVHSPHLSDVERIEYSAYIVMAAKENNIDPFLVAAVMWHESWFTNIPRNRTNDYGLMQLHWQKVPWLEGLTKQDLMIPRINIYAGVRELAYLRKFCRHRRDGDHEWWSHYKWGVVVPSTEYGLKILFKYKALLNHRPRSRTKSQT